MRTATPSPSREKLTPPADSGIGRVLHGSAEAQPYRAAMAWKKWLNSLPFDLEVEPASTFGDARAQVLEAFCDCTGPACERMRWKIDAARDARDLWLLRGDLFQLLAAQHCQAVATQRINGLLPAFEGLLPDRLLTPI